MSDDDPAGLPTPTPEMVRAARAYLAPRYAAGVDAFLWEAMELPLPDFESIRAVIAASGEAQRGCGDQPEPIEVAAALVVLGAVRLDVDQMEARLLNVAQAAAMGWEQIAAILDVSVEEAEERHRRLKPRLDVPAAEACRPHRRGTGPPGGAAKTQSPPSRSPVGAAASPWDEPEDGEWDVW